MKTDAEIEALLADWVCSERHKSATARCDRLADLVREQRAEIARLTGDNEFLHERRGELVIERDRYKAALGEYPEGRDVFLGGALAEVENQKQRIAELEEALADIMEMLDAGFLVRNTAADNDPAWAIKDIPYLVKLGKAAALAPRKVET